MTTRKELLDNFEAKLDAEGSFLMPALGNDTLPDKKMPDERSWIHEDYTSLDSQHVVEWHQCIYWDNVADNVTKQAFYVKDRATVDEEATWFKGNNPKPPTPEPTFQQQLTTWLQSKVADDTIEHYSSVSPIEQTETATATVLLRQSGDLVERRVKLSKDVEGNAQYEVIKE